MSLSTGGVYRAGDWREARFGLERNRLWNGFFRLLPKCRALRGLPRHAFCDRLDGCARLHSFSAAMEVEIDPSLVSQQRKDLEFLLSRKAIALSHGSLKATPLLLEGDPKRMIPELATAMAPSLVVLGTHGGERLVRKSSGPLPKAFSDRLRRPFLPLVPRLRQRQGNARFLSAFCTPPI